MNWGIEDLVTAAVLVTMALIGALIALRQRGFVKRSVGILIILAAVVIWAELAVGIFD